MSTEDPRPTAGLPPYGSVEHYVGIIRNNCRDRGEVYVVALALVEAVSVDGTDLEVLARVRNVVAAARQVLEELR
jgi:hypothetical protein